jgi:uncharacterized membrane protein
MGELYALASALCFGFSNVAIMRGAPRGAADNGAFLSLLLTAAISGTGWLLMGSLRGFAPITGIGVLWLAGAGVFTAFIGRVFLYASVQHLGAVRATAIKRMNPFFAVLLGMLVLGETLSGGAGWGLVLILLSFAVLIHAQLRTSASGGAQVGAWRRLFNLGYMYGPVSALGYGLGYLMRKAGLHDTPDPLFGAMVGTLVGVLLFLIAGRFSTSYRLAVQGTFRRANPWLYAAGTAASFGQIFYFAALNVSPMSRVALITSLEAFITMGLSLAFFGERLSPLVLLATLLAVAGAVLLLVG